jgi:hypothetical protein
MAVEMTNVSIFTVKYLDPDGIQRFVDLQAVGSSDAQDKFAREYRGCSIVNVYRKQ